MDTETPGLVEVLNCLISGTDEQLNSAASNARHLLCKFIAQHDTKARVPGVGDLDVSHLHSIIKLLQRSTALDSAFLVLVLKLLKILSRESSFRTLAGKECVANLMPCLRCAANARVSAEGVNVILNLCFEKENVLTLLDHDGPKLLLQFLQEPDHTLLFNATGAIQSICFHRQGRKHLFRLGCVPALLRLLDTDHNNVQERAAAAIHNLSADSEAIKSLRQHHAIPKLVALLDSPRLRIAASAAGALQNMSREVASRLAVLELHATGPLTNLLSSTEPQAQVCAAGALLNIMGPDLDTMQGGDSARQATLRIVSMLLSTSMIYHALFQDRPPLDLLDLEAIQRPPSAMSHASMGPERSRASMDGIHVPASGAPCSWNSTRRWSGRSLTRDLLERPRSRGSDAGLSGHMCSATERPQSRGSDVSLSGQFNSMTESAGALRIDRPHSAAEVVRCVLRCSAQEAGDSTTVRESVDLSAPNQTQYTPDLVGGGLESGVLEDLGDFSSRFAEQLELCDVDVFDSHSLPSAAEVSALLRSGGLPRWGDVAKSQDDEQLDLGFAVKDTRRDRLLPHHNTHAPLRGDPHAPLSENTREQLVGDTHGNLRSSTHAGCAGNIHLQGGGGAHAAPIRQQPCGRIPDLDGLFCRRLESWGSETGSGDPVEEDAVEEVWPQLSTRSGASGRLVPWCSSSKSTSDRPPVPSSSVHSRMGHAWAASAQTGSPVHVMHMTGPNEQLGATGTGTVATGTACKSLRDVGRQSNKTEWTRQQRQGSAGWMLSSQTSNTLRDADTLPATDKSKRGAPATRTTHNSHILELGRKPGSTPNLQQKGLIHAVGPKAKAMAHRPWSGHLVSSSVDDAVLGAMRGSQPSHGNLTRQDDRTRLNHSCDGSLGIM